MSQPDPTGVEYQLTRLDGTVLLDFTAPPGITDFTAYFAANPGADIVTTTLVITATGTDQGGNTSAATVSVLVSSHAAASVAGPCLFRTRVFPGSPWTIAAYYPAGIPGPSQPWTGAGQGGPQTGLGV
jgi:hypothetical protein